MTKGGEREQSRGFAMNGVQALATISSQTMRCKLWRPRPAVSPAEACKFMSLMTSRKFAPLFWCQLCSALNDNFLKNALAMLILFGLGGAGGAAGESGGMLITVWGIVFIAPFFILSALGGELADRYDKAFVAQRIRLCEIPVAALAAMGFFLHSVPILFLALGLFGVVADCSGRSNTASCQRSCRRPSCPPATLW